MNITLCAASNMHTIYALLWQLTRSSKRKVMFITTHNVSCMIAALCVSWIHSGRVSCHRVESCKSHTCRIHAVNWALCVYASPSTTAKSDMIYNACIEQSRIKNTTHTQGILLHIFSLFIASPYPTSHTWRIHLCCCERFTIKCVKCRVCFTRAWAVLR